MEINNSLAKTAGNPGTFSQFLGSDGMKKSIEKVLGNQKAAERFVSSLVTAVSTNPDLQKCDFSSIVSAGFQANELGLSLSPSLGFGSIVPFDDKKHGITVGTFIPGYKGYIQLAMRSGFYTDIDAQEIKEGEYAGRDKFTGKDKFSFIEDRNEWKKRKTIGYRAYYEMTNGFKRSVYWTKEEIIDHADRYVPGFSKNATTGRYPKVSFADYEAGNYPKGDEWLYKGKWYQDFTGMALKTMLRQLFKIAILSRDMQAAYENDVAYESENKTGVSDVSFTVQADVENDLFDGEETTPAAEPAKKRGRPAKKTDEPTEAEQPAPEVETIFPDAEDVFGDLN